MKYIVLLDLIGALSRLWKSMAAFTLLSIFGPNAFAQDVFTPKLAVINTMGQVWARDLSKNDVGAGAKLNGPGLFGGPDDRFYKHHVRNNHIGGSLASPP